MFLDAFTVEFGVAARLKLRIEVLRVAPLRKRWAVTWHREDGQGVEEAFDVVVICKPLSGNPGWMAAATNTEALRSPPPSPLRMTSPNLTFLSIIEEGRIYVSDIGERWRRHSP